MLVLALALPLMGANCNQAPPGCPYAQTCSDPDVRQCLNFCVPQAQLPVLPDGGTAPPPRPMICSLDPCDQAAMSTLGVVMCPEGWRCTQPSTPSAPGLGVCAPAPGRFGQSCGLAPGYSFDRCETGTFCAPNYCPVADAIRKLPQDPPLPPTGMVCAFPIREGEICDSDLADRRSLDPEIRARANLRCAPCEAGTYCLSNQVSGHNGPPDEMRCVRRCEASDGTPDPELCSCNQAACQDRGTVMNPLSHAVEGRFFCNACTQDNHRPCADSAGVPQLSCCDAQASCQAVTDLNGDPNHVCCRAPTTACDPSDRAAGHDTCCNGSACGQSGRCESCTGAGQGPLGGECCPGLEPIPESALGQSNSSRLVCHACSQVPGGTYACSNDRFLVHHFVRVENVPVPAVDHPWRATVGTAGGALNPAFGPSINVDYSLDDRYRAFLLQGYDHGSTHVDLSTAAGGDTFLALPLHSSLPRRVERLTTDYQHARIYDSGDCSLTLGWTDLTNLFAVGVNTEVGNAAASEPLVHWVRSDSFTLAPTLDSEPTYPASFPLGPLTEHDQMHIQADFTAGTGTILGIGCSHDTAHVHVALDARVVLHDGFFETPESTEQLALLRQVGCVVDPESDKLYRCTLPRLGTAADGTTTVTLFHATFGRHDSGAPDASYRDYRLDQIDRHMAQVYCQVQRGTFTCSLPNTHAALSSPEDVIRWQRDPAYLDSTVYPGEGCFYYGEPYPPMTPPIPTALVSPEEQARREAAFRAQQAQEQFCRRHWPIIFSSAHGVRPVDYPPDAKDLGLELFNVSVDVTGCSRGPFQMANRIATRNVQGPLLMALANIQVPDLLSKVLGERADSAPPVGPGVDPATLPACRTRAECRATPSFGGYRYDCLDTSAGRRCAKVRYEPRRINVRPDGMEFVLADGRGDPQHPLLDGRTLPVFASAPQNALCGPNRPDVVPSSFLSRNLRAQHMQTAFAGRSYLGRSCAFDDPTCRDICPALGVRCAQAYLLGYTVLPPFCVNGSCPGITP